MFVLVLLGHFLNSSEFWLLYRAHGARSGVFENWFLFLAGQLGNHLPAQAGTLYRVRYMRAVHDVPYAGSAAVYGANLVATLAGAAIVGLVGVVAAALVTDDLHVLMLLVALGVAALAVAFAVVPLPRFAARHGRLARAWRGFHAGFEQIRSNPAVALAVLAIEVVKYFLTAWRFAIAFGLIGVHEPFALYLVLAPAAGLAGFVAFTPGALGFRELFVTGAAVGMGVDLDLGLLSATIDRAVMFATSVVGGALGFLVTYPRLRAATAAQSERRVGQPARAASAT
jgi:uncharacterized membrane protein YbhN (UPF0104 family)